MKPIPTRPVWYIFGRDAEGAIKSIDRFWTADEAETALEERTKDAKDLSYTIEESESIIPDRTLPNKEQLVELGTFLHRAFVVLRSISYQRETFEPIEKLTDILHNLPEEVYDADRWDWNFYISALRSFRDDFPDVQTLNLAEMLETIRDRAEQAGDAN